METLTCEKCGSDWQRESVRGRKPKNCPDCKAGKAPAATTSTPKATSLPVKRMLGSEKARNKNIDPAVKARPLSQRTSGWCTDYHMGPVAQHWRCDADLGKLQCRCECHR